MRRAGVGLLFALTSAISSATRAQLPADSAGRHADGPARAWLSLGLGGGNSSAGGVAARAAASLAVNRVVVFTLEETSLGGFEESVSSTNILVGLQTPDVNQFAFLSAGWANAHCSSGCGAHSGIALDGGVHLGGNHAGVSFVGFAIRAPGQSSSSGIVVSIDLGWFAPFSGYSIRPSSSTP